MCLPFYRTILIIVIYAYESTPTLAATFYKHIMCSLKSFITRDWRVCIGKSVHRSYQKHAFNIKISTQCE